MSPWTIISGRTRSNGIRGGGGHLRFAVGVVHGGHVGAAEKLLPRHQRCPGAVILLYRLLVVVNAELAPVLDERVRRLNVSIPGDKRSRPRCILKPVPPCVKQIIGSVSGNVTISGYWENHLTIKKRNGASCPERASS